MSTTQIQKIVTDGINAFAWMLVLKNTDVVEFSATFGEEGNEQEIKFEFRLQKPADFDKLKLLMTGKP